MNFWVTAIPRKRREDSVYTASYLSTLVAVVPLTPPLAPLTREPQDAVFQRFKSLGGSPVDGLTLAYRHRRRRRACYCRGAVAPIELQPHTLSFH